MEKESVKDRLGHIGHDEPGHVHGPHCSHHQEPYVRTAAKVGRNDPCPCGSQQKYKKCHGSGR